MLQKTIFAIFVLIAIAIRVLAQIPNNGFENWTSKGSYYNPNSWGCLNDKTALLSKYTCERGTPGNPGNFYLKLTSKTVAGIGVVPGIAISGTFDQTTFKPLTGFAFNQRPVSLTGSWQYMGFGSTEGFVDIQLTRWDSSMQVRIPVASAHYILTGMEMNWINFTIPLTYADGNKPDSCIIVLSASGSVPTDGDFLYIDDLAFSGSMAGISDNEQSANFKIFPNPSCGILSLDLSAQNSGQISCRIFTMDGKLIKIMNTLDASLNTLIDVSDLTNGIYLLEIKSNECVEKQRLIIQK